MDIYIRAFDPQPNMIYPRIPSRFVLNTIWLPSGDQKRARLPFLRKLTLAGTVAFMT